jgi:tetraacyldisaccharide 4'-kinase
MPSAPQFWERPAGLAAALLAPIGAAWDAAGRLRRAMARPYRAPIPVVCVGNLVVGGAGKTPVVMALGTWLAGQSVRPHIVSRGYRGRLAGPVRVDPSRHSVAAIGDEALLLARCLPCWVARDRAAGIRAAAAAGAEAVLLDDGFQSPAFAKTLSLLVVDAAYLFGNGRLIPGGPLRESPERGLARADAVVLVRGSGEWHRGEPHAIFGDRPLLTAEVVPIAGERFAGTRLLAFAGIGRPEKFFADLRRLGAEVIEARVFPDHHRFRARDIAVLRRAAARTRSRLVTTAKDMVRVPPSERGDIEVLEIEIRWIEPEALVRLLTPILDMTHGGVPLSIERGQTQAAESGAGESGSEFAV